MKTAKDSYFGIRGSIVAGVQQTIDERISEGEEPMQKILLPVDESPNSLYAVRQVAREFFKNSRLEIHLLNVRRPFSSNVTRFVSQRSLESYYRDEAEKALKPCREILEKYGIPYSRHIETGNRAEVIVAVAKRLNCDLILLGSARKSSLIRLLEASTTNRVMQLATVPVLIVPGEAISFHQRYGLPAGVAAAIAALLIVAAVD